ncbi:MAG: response regulator [Planctomycetes bacterium]|nr:response regulator [Planctomycetota bacterium]
MRLEDMTPAHVRRAVELFLERAYPPDQPATPKVTAAVLEGAVNMADVFGRMEHRVQDQEDGSLRFTLRLGNARYPFMKFVVQEYLVDEEFFFSVDTHDNLDVRPNSPDYAKFQALKDYNRVLRESIERAWRDADLPTLEDLRALVEGLAAVEREEKKTMRLLIVDDEQHVCEGLGALLRARGYDVETCFTGEAVLERIAHGPLPDLVLLDYELPGVDGEEVLARLRADPRTAHVPVLMATASEIELSRLRRVSGLLHKPYSREVLFTMIAQLLARVEPPPRAP